MARPRVRTARATPAEVAEIKQLFGTITNAHARLMPGSAPLGWQVFRLAAGGHFVRPGDLEAMRRSLGDWKRAKLRG